MWQNSTLVGPSGPLPLSGNGPGIALLVVIAVFTFLALLAFSLRLLTIYLRRRITRASDYLAFFGLIFCLAEAGVYSYAVVGAGFGRHMVELDAPTLSNFYKAALAAGFCWILATTFVKLSILSFYLELFTVNRKFVIACWTILISSLIFFVGFVIAVFTQCRPFDYYWMSPVYGHSGVCSSPLPLLLASTVVNMVLDLAIFILPIPVLWNLNLPMRTKIEVNGVFAVAFLIFIMNMVRLIVASIKGVEDYTYNNIPQTMMVLMETQVGLISCCLPTLAPLWRRNHAVLSRKDRRRSKKSISDDLTANDGSPPKPRGASVGGPNGDPNTFNSVGSEEKGLMTLSMILEESDMRSNRR